MDPEVRTAGISVWSWRVLPWVLLALSLALNLFFIGGHVYTRSLVHRLGESRLERTTLMAERLGLTAEQKAAFNGLQAKYRARAVGYRGAAREAAEKIWAELAKAKPDQAVVDRNLKALFDNRYELQREASRYTIEFMAGLQPAQKERFLALVRQRNFLGANLLRHAPTQDVNQR